MKTEVILTGASAIAAVVSALVAWRSTSIARRALRLAEADHAKSDAPLSLYLVDGFRYRAEGEARNRQFLGFSLSVTNTSTHPNSIVRIELHVDCVSPDGRKVEYVLPHAADLAKRIHQADLTPFDCPCSLGAKESRSRWAIFEESEVIPSEVRRDSYRVVVTDALVNTSEVSSLIVSDLPHEQDQNAKA